MNTDVICAERYWNVGSVFFPVTRVLYYVVFIIFVANFVKLD